MLFYNTLLLAHDHMYSTHMLGTDDKHNRISSVTRPSLLCGFATHARLLIGLILFLRQHWQAVQSVLVSVLAYSERFILSNLCLASCTLLHLTIERTLSFKYIMFAQSLALDQFKISGIYLDLSTSMRPCLYACVYAYMSMRPCIHVPRYLCMYVCICIFSISSECI